MRQDCPECGSDAVAVSRMVNLETREAKKVCGCFDCGAKGPKADTDEEAVRLWNEQGAVTRFVEAPMVPGPIPHQEDPAHGRVNTSDDDLYDGWDHDEDDDFLDFDCGMMPDGQCLKAGTEECDWECPRGGLALARLKETGDDYAR